MLDYKQFELSDSSFTSFIRTPSSSRGCLLSKQLVRHIQPCIYLFLMTLILLYIYELLHLLGVLFLWGGWVLSFKTFPAQEILLA